MTEGQEEVNGQQSQESTEAQPQQQPVDITGHPLQGLIPDNELQEKLQSSQEPRGGREEIETLPNNGGGEEKKETNPLSGGEVKSEERVEDNSETETKDDGSGDQKSSLTIESPLVGGKKDLGGSVEKTNEPLLDIENYDEINSKFEEKHGLSLDQALEYKNKYSEIETKYSEAEKEVNNLKQGLSNLPEEIHAAISAFENGSDYRQAFNARPALDYTKDADNYGDDLLKQYYPDVTDEDIERANPESDEYSEDAARWLNDRREMAKQKFEQDKNLYSKQAKEFEQQQEERRELFTRSVEASAPSVKEAFPEASDSLINELKDVAMSQTGLAERFYNQDGTLKNDALQKLALVDYGMEYIKSLETALQERYKSQGMEEAISKSDQSISRTHGQETDKNPRLEAKKKELNQLQDSRHF